MKRVLLLAACLFSYSLWAALPKDANFQVVTSSVLSNLKSCDDKAAALVKDYRTKTPTVTITPTPKAGVTETATPTPGK